ncbi:MAG: cation transporter [bacterium]|nr:cation transporter [Candidatus Colousia faecequi]
MKKSILTLMVAMVSVLAMAENKTVKLYIPGMECKNCQAKVENVLNYEKGVKKLTVELEKRIVTIVYDDAKTNVQTLQAALLKDLKFKSQEIKGEGHQGCGHSCGNSCGHSCGHNHGQGGCGHNQGDNNKK